MLPSFFIVGAQKAGTTSLNDWLKQQPDILLPAIKETHFFDDDKRYALGLNWYQKQFGNKNYSNKIIGEVCPDYMYFPKAPERIKNYLQTPKFVFIFREPLSRAFSHYLMSVSRGHEKLAFNQALIEEDDRLVSENNGFAMNHYSYFSRGRYETQIKRFYQLFPDSEYLFVKFDDLVGLSNKFETYCKICDFLGIKSNPDMADLSKKQNQAGESRSEIMRDLIHNGGKFRHYLSFLIPSKDLRTYIKVKIDKINKKPFHKKPYLIYNQIPQKFIIEAKKETEKLERIAHLDLANWKHTLDNSLV